MSQQSDSIVELAKAMAIVQASLNGALKDSTNPFFKSNYADLESVWDACRSPLTKNGLSVVQTTDSGPNGIELVTTLLHTSGQWIRGRLPITAIKAEPQAVGSAITYARRYALAAMIGVVQVDDDGEAAHGRGKASAPAEKPSAKIKPTSAPSPNGDTCGLCNTALQKTKKNDALYCPNFKDRSGGEHTYIKLEK